jgi:hypothetical protein
MTDLDVAVTTIVGNKTIARITTTEDFAATYCIAIVNEATDYIVVSRGDEILWVVDGMTPGWYIPKSTQDVFDRYPELKGKC